MRYARHFGRRTKIVCTIGPATGSATAIEQLIKAGMDVARLNLAHGSYGEHSGYIDATRKAAQRLSIPVAIVMDLPGPKYRTGALRADSVVLKRGAQLTLTTRQLEGNESVVPVKYPSFTRDVEVGGTVLLGDGAIELRVQSIRASEVKCKVVIGGVLTAGRGIVIP
ncbi:MAG: pyruvate kinase, partial [Dehalococcoidia bacterium]|nr:pyruvate kinase [Dehalococcoidia bacterium]